MLGTDGRIGDMKKVISFLGLALLGVCAGEQVGEAKNALPPVGEVRKALLGAGAPVKKESKEVSAEEAALRKAAEKGDAEAQYRLARLIKPEDPSSGVCCMNRGDRVNPSFVLMKRVSSESDIEAAKWYLAAAKQGHAMAQYCVALCYDYGDGVDEDKAECVRWYRAAADQGHILAQFNLASYYYIGQGVEKDVQEAIRRFRLAAEAGEVRAQCNMGLFYVQGEDVEKNLEEAVRWFRLAADQGDADGEYNLGLCYEDGEGVPADREEALKWYHKAAEKGHKLANRRLEELEPKPQEKP